MSYTTVDINQHLANVEAQIDKAKTSNQYAGREQSWDQQVNEVLKKDCAIFEYNIKLNTELTETLRRTAQGHVEQAGKAAAKKAMEQTDYDLVGQAPGSIQKIIDRLQSDSTELMTANDQYRKTWPADARALLSNPAIVEPYRAAREKLIDDTARITSLKKRCAEYLQRAGEYAKQAKQHENQGKVDMVSFQNDIDAIKKTMETGRDAIKAAHSKNKTWITNMATQGKLKLWSPDQTKNAVNFMKEIAAAAKDSRGKLKTLRVEIDGLEKRANAAGFGWKEPALKAVSKATAPYKEAATASKAFDEDEQKCRKICTEHKVTV